MRSIIVRFTRVNQRNYPWWWGSPQKNNNQLACYCCWVLPLWLSARYLNLQSTKGFVESGWTQQSNRLVFGNGLMIKNKMKTVILMATRSHQNNVFLDDWFSNQHHSKKSKQSSCWCLLLCLFGGDEWVFSEANWLPDLECKLLCANDICTTLLCTMFDNFQTLCTIQ